METDLRSPDLRKNQLKRLVFIVLFAVIFNVGEVVISVIVVIQFGAMVAVGRPVARLLPLSRSLAIYVRQILHFLTYLTDEAPYPFAPWPAHTAAEAGGVPGGEHWPPDDAGDDPGVPGEGPTESTMGGETGQRPQGPPGEETTTGPESGPTPTEDPRQEPE